MKNDEIAKELSLPPVKLHCSSKFVVFKVFEIIRRFKVTFGEVVNLHFDKITLFDISAQILTNRFDFSVLAHDAIQAALNDYHKKQKKPAEESAQ